MVLEVAKMAWLVGLLEVGIEVILVVWGVIFGKLNF